MKARRRGGEEAVDERLRVQLPDEPTGARTRRGGGELASRRPSPDGPSPDGPSPDDPTSDDPRRPARHAAIWAGAQRWLGRPQRMLVVAIVALFIAGTGLGAAGILTVRDSTAGKRVDPTTDPNDPGFEAFVTPTPTMLLQHVHGGELVSAALLVLGAGDAGGTVVLIPGETAVEFPQIGTFTLAAAHGFRGSDAVVTGVQVLLHLGVGESVVVDDAQWARLVANVAPIEVENPDEVAAIDADGTAREFSAGALALEANDVGLYLSASAADESVVNRMTRDQLLWEAWLDAMRARSGAAIPGEAAAGLGRFLRTLIAGTPTVQLLPVDVDEVDAGERPTLHPRDAEIADLVALTVPLPTGPAPGARTRVRLLNGTTDRAAASLATQVLVRELAEITILGNAERFGVERTQVAYYTAAFEAEARRLARALGGADVVQDDRSRATADVVDITVRIGADFTAD